MGLIFSAIDGGILVAEIKSGSAAARSGLLDVGDQVLQLDATSFENRSNEDCIALLKRAAVEKRQVSSARSTTSRRHRTF